MSISTDSVLEVLLETIPELRTQIYFKASLTALLRAMEDQILVAGDRPLVIANFQQERFYRQEVHRYEKIAGQTRHVYVLAAAEGNFTHSSDLYETIAFPRQDTLTQERHLVVIGDGYASCLICREKTDTFMNSAYRRKEEQLELPGMDQMRRYEGIWTLDRDVSWEVANILLERILVYRPELKDKIKRALKIYGVGNKRCKEKSKTDFAKPVLAPPLPELRDIFAQRLVSYLQAGQYKLIKAYRAIASKERKERLVNLIASAIRRSLDPAEICQVAVQELGSALLASRCFLYRCKETDTTATILHEFILPNHNLGNSNLPSLIGQSWPLKYHPLFQYVVQRMEGVGVVNNVWLLGGEGKIEQSVPMVILDEFPANIQHKKLQQLCQCWQIVAWLLVPILYQGKLLGIVELHQCEELLVEWQKDELELVEAIATQLGAALIQAENHANLEDLNQQLEALDRTRRNLIAITGHELRTPLSTIQVCLETLAGDPEMSVELRQVMLDTALIDAERLRKLVQDFLTLSHLESGTVKWNLESLPLRECVDLAMSSLQHHTTQKLPKIKLQLPKELPLVQTDGEWLVDVISKLLDNACKFTKPDGQVIIKANQKDLKMLEVTIADTGRGIEPNQLEVVFDRFYQEEGALQRTVGGTGLGLTICRQIIDKLGGRIWAESKGKDKGSEFHFTIPIAVTNKEMINHHNEVKNQVSWAH